MDHWKSNVLADPTVTARTVLADGEVAGNVVSFGWDGKREVGYWIGRGHWGKGIATQALGAFLQVETARPLYAAVAKHNLGSIRILEKCGFTPADDSDLPPPNDEVEFVFLRIDR
jgi:RimJ/RimL family protein N-acetyltransferase